MPVSVRFRLKTRLLITLLLLSTVLLVQNVRSVPLSSQSLMKSPKPMSPPYSMAENVTVTSAPASNESIPATGRHGEHKLPVFTRRGQDVLQLLIQVPFGNLLTALPRPQYR